MSAANDATAQALAAVAAAKGLPFTSEQAATLTEQAAELLANFLVGQLDKKVKADGDAAVAGITTLEAAEQSAGKR